jgi:hypothetical protein
MTATGALVRAYGEQENQCQISYEPHLCYSSSEEDLQSREQSLQAFHCVFLETCSQVHRKLSLRLLQAGTGRTQVSEQESRVMYYRMK